MMGPLRPKPVASETQRGFALRAVLAGTVAVVAGLTIAAFAGAAKVEPVLLPGASNQGKSCDDNEGAGQSWIELKIDPNADGVFSDGTLTVTISNTQSDKTFDWSSNIGVDAVIVKAGSEGSYLYRYDPPQEETSDTGLTTPGASGNGISHISFCYDVTPKGRLTVIKRVVNDDGGTATPGDWTMNVAGPTPLSFPGAVDPGTTNEVDAGDYTVTESGPSGYTLTYSGDCDANGNVTVPAFHDRTCILTNDDQPASLTVVKRVVNDHGGTAAAGDWTMNVAGPTPLSFAGAEAPGTTNPVDAGNYTVTESGGPSGYALTYSGDCDAQGNVSLAPGQSKTCTLTNDDEAASLTVIKRVVNDHGGTAVSADWTMNVSGPTALSFAGASDPGTTNSVNPGSYTITESGGPSGYTLSYSGDCDAQGNLAIAAGQSKTCILTNDDQPASLTVIKHVVNDDGGSALASDWTMSVIGPTPLSFAGAEAPGTTNQVAAGNYSITESGGPAGYALTYSGDCDSAGSLALAPGESKTCTLTNDDRAASLTVIKHVVNDHGGSAEAGDWTMLVSGPTNLSFAGEEAPGTTNAVDPGHYEITEAGGPSGYVLTYSGDCDAEGNVTLELGDEKTCTLTNDDQPASLTVIKHVVNDSGGAAVASNWTMNVSGPTNLSFAGAEAPGTTSPVHPGAYAITESGGPSGYALSYSGDCDVNGNVSVALGESKTCTLTNNDLAHGRGSIDVQKSATPTSMKEPGGPVTFSVRITNTSSVNVTITEVFDNVFGDLDDSGGNGCFDVPINIPPGGFATCQFTAPVTGPAGAVHVNTVTASGGDEFGNPVSDSDDARVDITERLIDLVIVKEASSPTPLNGIVNYTMTVTNKGPDTATNVQLADPAPAGITYLTVNTTQGSCTLTAALITCNLGTLAAGQTATITVTARATAVGTHVNTATVTGSGGRETAPADNVDSAQTVVPAPFVPPTAKPKPKPQPEVCLTLTVTPKMITADGKPDRIVVRATAGKKRMKGVRILVRGSGVNKTSRTKGNGATTMRINPKRAGIVTITAIETNRRVCGPKRIGVVGVFLPPVTG